MTDPKALAAKPVRSSPIVAKIESFLNGNPERLRWFDIMNEIRNLEAALEEASNDKAKVLKAKVKALSSLMPWYCGDCGKWFLYSAAEHDSAHTISKPVKFIRAEEVLKLIAEEERKA